MTKMTENAMTHKSEKAMTRKINKAMTSKRVRVARRLNKLTAAINKSHLVYGGVIASQLAIAPAVLAGPKGGTIVGGQGDISRSGLNTNINQATGKLAIDWQSFNVNANEAVNFAQPSSSSIVLNRILDQSPSAIHGQINANGHVVLVNPRGILFTETSSINVGALTASGLDIKATDFMNGDMLFKGSDGEDGTIINRGVINASSVALIGKQVTNDTSGLISADVVSLSAADEALLTFDQDGMIGVKVTKAVMENDMGVDSAVLNSGEINGQQVLMQASVSQDLFTQAVNNTGTVRARGIDTSGGKITLFGSGASVVNSGTLDASGALNGGGVDLTADKGVINTGIIDASGNFDGGSIQLKGGSSVENSGTLNASGDLNGGSIHIEGDKAINTGSVIADGGTGIGGDIKILGDEVEVVGDSYVSAQGDSGGGEILIGGDYQGENLDVRNATQTTIGVDAQILAAAREDGNGGKVIVWANEDAYFYGFIDASSGLLGGDGGFIETSGKVNLTVAGNVVAKSHKGGEAGTWLLDPQEFVIRNGIGDTLAETRAANGISDTKIEEILNDGTSVHIKVENKFRTKIYSDTDNDGVNDSSFGVFPDDTVRNNGGIKVESSIDVSLTHEGVSLTLETLDVSGIDPLSADKDNIHINANITNSGGKGLNVKLISDGTIALAEDVVVTTKGGTFTAEATATNTTTKTESFTMEANSAINTDGGNVTIDTKVFNNKDAAAGIDAGTGNVTLNVGLADTVSTQNIGLISANMLTVDAQGTAEVNITQAINTAIASGNTAATSGLKIDTAGAVNFNANVTTLGGNILIGETIAPSSVNIDPADNVTVLLSTLPATGSGGGTFTSTQGNFVNNGTVNTGSGAITLTVGKNQDSSESTLGDLLSTTEISVTGASTKNDDKISLASGAKLSVDGTSKKTTVDRSGQKYASTDTDLGNIALNTIEKIHSDNSTLTDTAVAAQTFKLGNNDTDAGLDATALYVTAADVLFSGLTDVIGSGKTILQASDANDLFTVQSGFSDIGVADKSIDVKADRKGLTGSTILFSGLAELNTLESLVTVNLDAIATGEEATSASLINDDSAEFDLTGTASAAVHFYRDNAAGDGKEELLISGADIINNSRRLKMSSAKSDSFDLDTNTANAIVFNNLETLKGGDGVDGDGAAYVDTLVGKTDQQWQLLASGFEATDSAIEFSGFEIIQSTGTSAKLTGTTSAENYALNDVDGSSSMSIVTGGMTFTGLAELDTGGSADEATAAIDTISNSATSTLVALVEIDGDAGKNPDANKLTISRETGADGTSKHSINVTNVEKITGTQAFKATGRKDTFVYANIKSGADNLGADAGIVVEDVTSVDGGGGGDVVVGADDQAWSLVKTTEVVVDGGGPGVDTEVHTRVDNAISVDGFVFTSISEAQQGDGTAANKGTLAGSLAGDSLFMGDSGELTANGVAFTNLTEFSSGDRADTLDDEVSGAATLKSTDFTLYAAQVTANGMDFLGIDKANISWEAGDSLALGANHGLDTQTIDGKGAGLIGSSGDDLFTITADTNKVAFLADEKTVNFTNLGKVDGGGETTTAGDKVVATGADWQLGASEKVITVVDQFVPADPAADPSAPVDSSQFSIVFKNIESAEDLSSEGHITASNDRAEEFTVTGTDNDIKVSGIQFSGISEANGLSESGGDTVVDLGDNDYALHSADKIEINNILIAGLAASNFSWSLGDTLGLAAGHTISNDAASAIALNQAILVGTNTADTFALIGTNVTTDLDTLSLTHTEEREIDDGDGGTVLADVDLTVFFSGVSRVEAGDEAGDSVTGVAAESWQLLGDNSVKTRNTITFTGIDKVGNSGDSSTLKGIDGTEEAITLTGAKALETSNIAFSGVAAAEFQTADGDSVTDTVGEAPAAVNRSVAYKLAQLQSVTADSIAFTGLKLIDFDWSAGDSLSLAEGHGLDGETINSNGATLMGTAGNDLFTIDGTAAAGTGQLVLEHIDSTTKSVTFTNVIKVDAGDQLTDGKDTVVASGAAWAMGTDQNSVQVTQIVAEGDTPKYDIAFSSVEAAQEQATGTLTGNETVKETVNIVDDADNKTHKLVVNDGLEFVGIDTVTLQNAFADDGSGKQIDADSVTRSESQTFLLDSDSEISISKFFTDTTSSITFKGLTVTGENSAFSWGSGDSVGLAAGHLLDKKEIALSGAQLLDTADADTFTFDAATGNILLAHTDSTDSTAKSVTFTGATSVNASAGGTDKVVAANAFWTLNATDKSVQIADTVTEGETPTYQISFSGVELAEETATGTLIGTDAADSFTLANDGDTGALSIKSKAITFSGIDTLKAGDETDTIVNTADDTIVALVGDGTNTHDNKLTVTRAVTDKSVYKLDITGADKVTGTGAFKGSTAKEDFVVATILAGGEDFKASEISFEDITSVDGGGGGDTVTGGTDQVWNLTAAGVEAGGIEFSKVATASNAVTDAANGGTLNGFSDTADTYVLGGGTKVKSTNTGIDFQNITTVQAGDAATDSITGSATQQWSLVVDDSNKRVANAVDANSISFTGIEGATSAAEGTGANIVGTVDVDAFTIDDNTAKQVAVSGITFENITAIDAVATDNVVDTITSNATQETWKLVVDSGNVDTDKQLDIINNSLSVNDIMLSNIDKAIATEGDSIVTGSAGDDVFALVDGSADHLSANNMLFTGVASASGGVSKTQLSDTGSGAVVLSGGDQLTGISGQTWHLGASNVFNTLAASAGIEFSGIELISAANASVVAFDGVKENFAMLSDSALALDTNGTTGNGDSSGYSGYTAFDGVVSATVQTKGDKDTVADNGALTYQLAKVDKGGPKKSLQVTAGNIVFDSDDTNFSLAWGADDTLSLTSDAAYGDIEVNGAKVLGTAGDDLYAFNAAGTEITYTATGRSALLKGTGSIDALEKGDNGDKVTLHAETDAAKTFTLADDADNAFAVWGVDFVSVEAADDLSGQSKIQASAKRQDTFTLGANSKDVSASGIVFSGVDEVLLQSDNADNDTTTDSVISGTAAREYLLKTSTQVRVNDINFNGLAVIGSAYSWDSDDSIGLDAEHDFTTSSSIDAKGAKLLGSENADKFTIIGQNATTATRADIDFTHGGDGDKVAVSFTDVSSVDGQGDRDTLVGTGTEAWKLYVQEDAADKFDNNRVSTDMGAAEFMFTDIEQVSGGASVTDTALAETLTITGDQEFNIGVGADTISFDSIATVNLGTDAGVDIVADADLSNLADTTGVELTYLLHTASKTQVSSNGTSNLLTINGALLGNYGWGSGDSLTLAADHTLDGETVVSNSATLLGTSGSDTFTISGTDIIQKHTDGDVKSVTFSGLDTVKGGGGAEDTVVAGANASWQLIDDGVATQSINFTDIDKANATGEATLTGTEAAETFTLSADDTKMLVSVNGIDFNNIDTLNTGDNATNNTGVVDTIENTLTDNSFTLVDGTSAVESNQLTALRGAHSIAIKQLEAVTGTGMLIGSKFNETFNLAQITSGTGTTLAGINFQDITAVDGGSAGTDTVTGGINEAWTLIAGGVKAQEISFTNIDIATASGNASLTGTAGDDTFNITENDNDLTSLARKVQANDIQFNSIATIDAGTDSGDSITSNNALGEDLELGLQFTLTHSTDDAVNTADSNSLKVNGITVSGIDHVTSTDAVIIGSDADDSFALVDLDLDNDSDTVDLTTTTLRANGIQFSDVASVDGGGNDAVSTTNKGDVLTGLSGQTWTMTKTEFDYSFSSNGGVKFEAVEVAEVIDNTAIIENDNTGEYKSEYFEMTSTTGSAQEATVRDNRDYREGDTSSDANYIFTGVAAMNLKGFDKFLDSGDNIYVLTTHNTAKVNNINITGGRGSAVWATGDTLKLDDNYTEFDQTILANGAAFSQDNGSDVYTVNNDATKDYDVQYDFEWAKGSNTAVHGDQTLYFDSLASADGGSEGADKVILESTVTTLNSINTGSSATGVMIDGVGAKLIGKDSNDNDVVLYDRTIDFHNMELVEGGTTFNGHEGANSFELTGAGFKANGVEVSKFSGDVSATANGGSGSLTGSTGKDKFVLDIDGSIKVDRVVGTAPSQVTYSLDFAGITGNIDGVSGGDTITGSGNDDAFTIGSDNTVQVTSKTAGTETVKSSYNFLNITGDIDAAGGTNSVAITTADALELQLKADSSAALNNQFSVSTRNYSNFASADLTAGNDKLVTVSGSNKADSFAIVSGTDISKIQANGIELTGVTGSIDGNEGLDTLTGSGVSETITLNNDAADITVVAAATVDTAGYTINFLDLGGAVDSAGGEDVVEVAAGVTNKNWILDDVSGAVKVGTAASSITFSSVAEAQGDGTVLTGSAGDDNFAVTADGLTANSIKFTSGKIVTVNAAGQDSSGDSATGLAGQNWSLAGAASGGSATNNGITFTGLENATSQTTELIGSTVADNYTVTATGKLSANGIQFSNTFIKVTDTNTGASGSDHVTGFETAAWELTGGSNNLNNAGIEFEGIETAESAATVINGSAQDDSFVVTSGTSITANSVEITTTAASFTEVTGGGTTDTDTVDASAIAGIIALEGSKAFTLDAIQYRGIEALTANTESVVTSLAAGSTYLLEKNNLVIADDIAISGLDYNGQNTALVNYYNLDSDDKVGISSDATDANLAAFSDTVTRNEATLIGTDGTDIFTIGSDNISLRGVKFSKSGAVDAIDGTDDKVIAEAGSTWLLTGTDHQAENASIQFSNIDIAEGGGLQGSDNADTYVITGTQKLTANNIGFTSITSINAMGNVSGSDTVHGLGGWTLGDSADAATPGAASNSGIDFVGIEVATGSGTGSEILTGSGDSDQFTVATANSYVDANGIQFSVKDSTDAHGGITQINAGNGADDSVTSDTNFVLNGASKEAATGVAAAIDMTGIESASGGNLVASDLADTFVVTDTNKVKANDIQFSGVSTIDAGLNNDNGGQTQDIVEGIGGWTLGTFAGIATDNTAINSGIEFSNIEVAYGTNTITGSLSADDFVVAADHVKGNQIEFSIKGHSVADTQGGITSVLAEGGDDAVTSLANNNLVLTGTANEVKNGAVTFENIQLATGSVLSDTAGVATTAYTLHVGGDITSSVIRFSGITEVLAIDGVDTVTSESTMDHWNLINDGGTAAANWAKNGGVTFKDIDVAYGTDTLQGSDVADEFTVAATHVVGNGIQFKVNDADVNGGITTVVADTVADLSVQTGDIVNAQSDVDFVLNGNDYEAKNNLVNFSGVDTAKGAGLVASAVADNFEVVDTEILNANKIRFEGISSVDAIGAGDDPVDVATAKAGTDWTLVETDNATVDAAQQYAVHNSGITFTNLEKAIGDSGLVGSADNDTVTVTGTGTFTANSVEFEGLDTDNQRFDLQGGTDTVVADDVALVALVSDTGVGQDNQIDTSELMFAGVDQVTNGTLQGSIGDDTFVVSGGALSANKISFSVSVVDAMGGTGDTVQGEGAWTLGSDDGLENTNGTAVNSGIEFINIEKASSEISVLNGSKFGDTFAVATDWVEGNGIEFSVDGAAASSHGGMTAVVAGDGSDTVTGLAGSDWSLLADNTGDTAVANAAINSGITFTEIETANGDSGLVGSVDNDRIVFTSTALFSANEIDFSGLNKSQAVDLGNGSDSVQAFEEKIVALTGVANPNQIETGGWLLSGVDEVTQGTLQGSDKADIFTINDDASLDANGIKFTVSVVDAMGHDGDGDTVIGSGDWTLASDDSGALANTAINKGITFKNIELAQGSSVVVGSAKSDTFTVTGDRHVSANGIAFSSGDQPLTEVGGITTVTGTGDDTVMIDAGTTDKVFELTGVDGALTTNNIAFEGLNKAKGGSITGSALQDTFAVDSDTQITANQIQFSSLTSQTIDAGENTDGSDVVTGTLAKKWSLTQNDSEASNNGFTFSNIEKAISNGTSVLDGSTATDTFKLSDVELEANKIVFENILTVNAGEFTDDLDHLEVDDLTIKLTGVSEQAEVVNSAGTTFTFNNIESAAGPVLEASENNDTFQIMADRTIEANDIIFQSLDVVDALGGDADTVIGTENLNWTLAIDADGNAEQNAAINNGTLFKNIEIAKALGNSKTLEGSTGKDTYTVSHDDYTDASGTLVSGSIIGNGVKFSVDGSSADNGGITTVNGNGGADSVVALVDPASVFAITASGSGTNDGITFDGVTSVAADKVEGSGTFTISSANALTSNTHSIDFTSVDSLTSKGGDDTVIGDSTQQWALQDKDTVKQHGITVANFETLKNSGILGTSGQDVMDIDAGGNLNISTINGVAAASTMSFEDVSSVNLAGGSNDIVSAGIHAWTLNAGSKSAKANNIDFSSFEIAEGGGSILTGSGSSDRFVVSSAGKITANDIEFTDSISTVNAAGSSDSVEAEAGAQWQLKGATALTVQDINFNSVEKATSTGSTLTDVSSSVDDMTLDNTGKLGVAGIQFTGVTTVDGNGNRVNGSAASWSASAGKATAAVSGISVVFTDVDTILNTGVFSGGNLTSTYKFTEINRMSFEGFNFDGVTQLNAGTGTDVLQGTNLDSSWNLAGDSGSVSSAGNSLGFSGFEEIEAGTGVDTVTMSSGNLASLTTGDGADIVYLNGGRINTVNTGSGNDRVVINNASSAPATLIGGSGVDDLDVNVSSLEWQVTGNVNATNYVGDFGFSQFENLANNSGALNLLTTFATTYDRNLVTFNNAGMSLSFNGSNDVVVDSRATGANAVTGTVVANRFDLSTSGDVDIDTEITGPLKITSNGSAISVDVSADEDLEVEQVLTNDGSILLSSKNFGKLSFSGRGETHLEANEVTLGTPQEQWVEIGDYLIPARVDAQTLDIVSFSYVEPEFVGQTPVITATGDKIESLSGAEASQGLKSAVQNAVEDFAQVDPGIFDAVSPYSIGVDAVYNPEVRLIAGILLPTEATAAGDDDEEERDESPIEQPVSDDQTGVELLQLRDDFPESYEIDGGDTLWDIAEKYLKDPLMWSELWKQNPQMDNPNLIYPGDVIKVIIENGKAFLTIHSGAGDDKLKQAVGLADVNVVTNRSDFAS